MERKKVRNPFVLPNKITNVNFHSLDKDISFSVHMNEKKNPVFIYVDCKKNYYFNMTKSCFYYSLFGVYKGGSIVSCNIPLSSQLDSLN